MVKREKGDSDEKMIKRFMKRVKKSGIIERVLSKRYYVKPSTRKRLEKKKMIADYKPTIKNKTRR